MVVIVHQKSGWERWIVFSMIYIAAGSAHTGKNPRLHLKTPVNRNFCRAPFAAVSSSFSGAKEGCCGEPGLLNLPVSRTGVRKAEDDAVAIRSLPCESLGLLRRACALPPRTEAVFSAHVPRHRDILSSRR